MTVNYSDGREAKTFYRVIERFNNATLVELIPLTGRTHQIRVHLAYSGHPVLGDKTYGKSSPLISRQALHAVYLGFSHPADGKFIEFRSPLPEDIERLLNFLRNKGK
jgi:23S rRNA-/tRNA-specific pseudouridylate synthase